MNIVSLILVIISGVCFVSSGGAFARRAEPVRYSLMPAGLAFFVAAWTLQLLWTSHAQQIHF